MSLAAHIIVGETGLTNFQKEELRDLQGRVFNMVISRTRTLFAPYKKVPGIVLKSPKAKKFEKLLEKHKSTISWQYLVAFKEMMEIITCEDIALPSQGNTGKFTPELLAMAAFAPIQNRNSHSYAIGRVIIAANSATAYADPHLSTGNNFEPFAEAVREATPEEILLFVEGISLANLKEHFVKRLKEFGF